MHNYDYYYTLCLLLQVTRKPVNSFTYELMNYHCPMCFLLRIKIGKQKDKRIKQQNTLLPFYSFVFYFISFLKIGCITLVRENTNYYENSFVFSCCHI